MSEIELIRRLIETKVEFVVVGGFAAITHGATRLTQDLDVCASFSEENLERLLAALSGIHPHFRAPARRPLPQRAQELAGYRNLYLETDLGDLDLLGEISGLGPYEVVRSRARHRFAVVPAGPSARDRCPHRSKTGPRPRQRPRRRSGARGCSREAAWAIGDRRIGVTTSEGATTL